MDYLKLVVTEWDNIHHWDAYDYVDATIVSAEYDGKELSKSEIEEIPSDILHEKLMEYLF